MFWFCLNDKYYIWIFFFFLFRIADYNNYIYFHVGGYEKNDKGKGKAQVSREYSWSGIFASGTLKLWHQCKTQWPLKTEVLTSSLQPKWEFYPMKKEEVLLETFWSSSDWHYYCDCSHLSPTIVSPVCKSNRVRFYITTANWK